MLPGCNSYEELRGKEARATRLKPLLPLLLLLFHSAAGSLVVDAVFGTDASNRGPLERVCQLQIGSVSMYDACAVLYFSPQQICFFKNMETFCKQLETISHFFVFHLDIVFYSIRFKKVYQRDFYYPIFI